QLPALRRSVGDLVPRRIEAVTFKAVNGLPQALQTAAVLPDRLKVPGGIKVGKVNLAHLVAGSVVVPRQDEGRQQVVQFLGKIVGLQRRGRQLQKSTQCRPACSDSQKAGRARVADVRPW